MGQWGQRIQLSNYCVAPLESRHAVAAIAMHGLQYRFEII